MHHIGRMDEKRTLPHASAESGPTLFSELNAVAEKLGGPAESMAQVRDKLAEAFGRARIFLELAIDDCKIDRETLRAMLNDDHPRGPTIWVLRELAALLDDCEERGAHPLVAVDDKWADLTHEQRVLYVHVMDLDLSDAPIRPAPGRTELEELLHLDRMQKWASDVIRQVIDLRQRRSSTEMLAFSSFLLDTIFIAMLVLPFDEITFDPHVNGFDPDRMSAYGHFVKAGVNLLSRYLLSSPLAQNQSARHFIGRKVRWDDSHDYRDRNRIYQRIYEHKALIKKAGLNK